MEKMSSAGNMGVIQYNSSGGETFEDKRFYYDNDKGGPINSTGSIGIDNAVGGYDPDL